MVGSSDWQEITTSGLIIASYVLFAYFALLAIMGALVTFHAIRSRFRYPKPALDVQRIESFLFGFRFRVLSLAYGLRAFGYK